MPREAPNLGRSRAASRARSCHAPAMAFAAVCAAAAIGMNVHLPPDDVLDLHKELGAEWIRIDFNWDIAEPSAGKYDWAPFDALLDASKARGLKVFATIGYTPAWASTGGTNGDA